ncbi:2-oxoglutarate-dependent dioxygenase [Drechslerella dactyloides]|uniref:2-oxoglutarate-dependent dioxygenase n=1 Tax=Drechslerella dactyloides TaxID=74499 RepID=A0AAD6ITP3_DREDA|nr:2-oxoglutarate-dependent dioxygenase [Drechslerella dactyloides]
MTPVITKAVVGNTEIDVAPLEVISLKLLLEDDEAECLKLYCAASSPGFFYVDVRDSKNYVADVEQLYSTTERYFTQPEDAKLRDFVEADEFRGYKGGKNWGSLEVNYLSISPLSHTVHPQLMPIAWKILRDDLLHKKVSLPMVVQPDAATIQRFISYSHEMVHTIIASLSKSLWPDSKKSLEDRHRSNEPNNSSLKVYRGPMLENLADVGDNTHTDGGTLTLLYTDKWGTQVELPWNKEWAWVKAKPGHAIVNVGDALQVLSGGKLHSCRHRVSQPVAGFEERMAEQNTRAPNSIQLYKDLYYKLQHLEQHPQVLPTARDVLISLFSETLELASETPKAGILSIHEYSRDALSEFQRKEDEKVMDQWEQYLTRRMAKGPREMFTTKEEAKWWLVQSSPVKYVDGAWLGHINKITTPFYLRRVAKNAWQVLSEELGDGDIEKNHVYIYRRLMEVVEPRLPTGDNPDFIHPRHQLNEHGVWKAAVAQLLISLFPHQFLPEIIGFNMHYEAMVLSTLKAAKELKELGFDPYYFILHISIDNGDSGHTAMALEVAMEYMELMQKKDGDAAAQQIWKRIQAGYILSKGLPTAPVCPSFKKLTSSPLQRKESFPRNDFEAEVIRIFRAKAAVSWKIHCGSRIKFGGHTIAEWLAPRALESEQKQMEFLDALSNTKPWIYKGDSGSKVCTVKEWIDSLGGGGGPNNPKFYWRFIDKDEIPSQNHLCTSTTFDLTPTEGI